MGQLLCGEVQQKRRTPPGLAGALPAWALPFRVNMPTWAHTLLSGDAPYVTFPGHKWHHTCPWEGHGSS